ncbi:hypothetical protein V8F33_000593 [Rhypophila sp. PSN 637]
MKSSEVGELALKYFSDRGRGDNTQTTSFIDQNAKESLSIQADAYPSTTAGGQKEQRSEREGRRRMDLGPEQVVGGDVEKVTTAEAGLGVKKADGQERQQQEPGPSLGMPPQLGLTLQTPQTWNLRGVEACSTRPVHPVQVEVPGMQPFPFRVKSRKGDVDGGLAPFANYLTGGGGSRIKGGYPDIKFNGKVGDLKVTSQAESSLEAKGRSWSVPALLLLFRGVKPNCVGPRIPRYRGLGLQGKGKSKRREIPLLSSGSFF